MAGASPAGRPSPRLALVRAPVFLSSCTPPSCLRLLARLARAKSSLSQASSSRVRLHSRRACAAHASAACMCWSCCSLSRRPPGPLGVDTGHRSAAGTLRGTPRPYCLLVALSLLSSLLLLLLLFLFLLLFLSSLFLRFRVFSSCVCLLRSSCVSPVLVEAHASWLSPPCSRAQVYTHLGLITC